MKWILCSSVFRLGKSLDMLMALTRAPNIEDMVVRVLVICRRLTYIIYYVIDHFTFAARLGLFKSDPKAWSKFQAKFWLVALVFGLLRNIYDLMNLLLGKKEKAEDGQENPPRGGAIQRVMTRPQVVLDTVKNTADFLLPFNVMGIIELNAGVAGLLGLISSLAGATPVWKPELKLKPSWSCYSLWYFSPSSNWNSFEGFSMVGGHTREWAWTLEGKLLGGGWQRMLFFAFFKLEQFWGIQYCMVGGHTCEWAWTLEGKLLGGGWQRMLFFAFFKLEQFWGIQYCMVGRTHMWASMDTGRENC